jgi:hypothetical protein
MAQQRPLSPMGERAGVREEREMNKGLGFMALMAVGLVVGWVGTGAAVGPTRADWCEATKLTAAGLKASCLAVEEAKGVLGGTPNPARCSGRFERAFTRAEAIAGPGVCPTEGDAAAIETQIDTCVADIAAALSGSPPSPCQQQLPVTGQTTCWNSAGTVIDCAGTGQDGDIQAGATPSSTDNGDGTITDNNTGLMWEKLCDEDPPGLTCPAEHDVDTAYTWADAFAVKIAALNAGAGFAGYTDWRLPNVKELQTIVEYGSILSSPLPAFISSCIAPCSVTDCSCTAGLDYWTSTTAFNVIAPHTAAWGVRFYVSGSVLAIDKASNNRVRAVRGGL